MKRTLQIASILLVILSFSHVVEGDCGFCIPIGEPDVALNFQSPLTCDPSGHGIWGLLGTGPLVLPDDQPGKFSSGNSWGSDDSFPRHPPSISWTDDSFPSQPTDTTYYVVVDGDLRVPRGFVPPNAWNPSPEDGATVPLLEGRPLILGWVPGKDAIQHDVYLSQDRAAVENANSLDVIEDPNIPDATGIYHGRQYAASFPFVIEPGTFYWRIDEVDKNGTLSTGYVWSFTVPGLPAISQTLGNLGVIGDVQPPAGLDDVRLYTPLDAWNPYPEDGDTVNGGPPVLAWTPGENAIQHDVFLGQDKDAVGNADNSDTTGIYRGRQNAANYPVGEPKETKKDELSQVPFYWRIDGINTDGAITTGPIWTFTANIQPLGQAGDDQLDGGAWKDRLQGGGLDEDDPPLGGPGNDTILGGLRDVLGGDDLTGGPGRGLRGGPGEDQIDELGGGAGDDQGGPEIDSVVDELYGGYGPPPGHPFWDVPGIRLIYTDDLLDTIANSGLSDAEKERVTAELPTVQKKINDGLKKLAETNEAAKDLYESGQTILICGFGGPTAIQVFGEKDKKTSGPGMVGGNADTKGDFSPDGTPKKRGHAVVAIDPGSLGTLGWFGTGSPFIPSFFDIMLHELLHAANSANTHENDAPLDLEAYKEWVNDLKTAIGQDDKSGGTTPGDTTSGGTTPGRTPRGGTPRGGTRRGGTTPGGTTRGGTRRGGMQPGGDTTKPAWGSPEHIRSEIERKTKKMNEARLAGNAAEAAKQESEIKALKGLLDVLTGVNQTDASNAATPPNQ